MVVDPEWREAEVIADAAWRGLDRAARRMRRKMGRGTAYQFMEQRGATPNKEDSYLAVREVTTPDADYPNVRRFESVTPGHLWVLRRQDLEDPQVLELDRTITLFVTDKRVARLRSGDLVLPATPENWKRMAFGVLAPGRSSGAAASTFLNELTDPFWVMIYLPTLIFIVVIVLLVVLL